MGSVAKYLHDFNFNFFYEVITASSANSGTKMVTVSNSMANNTATSKMGGAIPPGMMMQPQGYILGQAGTVPAFYSVQAPMYGFEDNSVQFVPRIPPQFPGYYDASAAGFGKHIANYLTSQHAFLLVPKPEAINIILKEQESLVHPVYQEEVMGQLFRRTRPQPMVVSNGLTVRQRRLVSKYFMKS